MGMNFTPEQQKVIELHNSNILVSAAAGSGKTAVLVERIIRMICEGEHPADIDRLLIVTFTNAAAAEMRERIAAGIAARLEADPGNDHIQKQSALLHNAQITTIDSFSLFLIRNHFNEIGLDPDFRVADEGEIKLLQQEVLGQLLEDAYAGKFVPDDVPTSRENRDSGAMIPKEASGNDFAEEVPGKRDSGDPSREARERFHACVEYFCPGGRESVLEQHILNLSRYAGSFPWPAEWLEERKNDYAAGDLDALLHSDYGQYLAERVSRVLQGCLEKLEEVKKLCELPDGPYMYGELTEAESEQLERLAACKDLKEQAAKVPAVTFGRLSSKKDESVDPAKRELAKSIRNSVKDTLADLTEQYFKTPLELVVEQGKACREPLRMLLNLVLEFDRRLLAAKQERHLIDFSDMEHYALQILLKREKVEETGDAGTDSAGDTGMDSTGVKYDIVPSDVALEYRQYFQEILIDEYQDSNLVQEYLLSAISGEAEGHYNRFMVGDVKQSIYKFRLARPELFMEKYDTYSREESSHQMIELQQNFRSRASVLTCINDIFYQIMTKNLGGIRYTEETALYPGAAFEETEKKAGIPVQFLVADTGTEAFKQLDEEAADYTARELEAKMIAEQIKSFTDEKNGLYVWDKDGQSYRKACYKDMVILLRSMSGWSEVFVNVLMNEGIPATAQTRTGYFATAEVETVLSLLSVIDNPMQDIPMAAVLRSPMVGMTDDEMAWMFAAYKFYARKKAKVMTVMPECL